MKTLADLKRVMAVGKCVQVIYRRKPLERPELCQVVKTQTNAVVFKYSDDVNSRESWLMWPKASLVEVTEDGFKIYLPGKRKMTAGEQYIRDNEPKDKKQSEMDLLTDGSTMYWRVKRYYKELNAEYLQGLELSQGMKFDHHSGLVIDEKVKGDLLLEYKF